MGSTVSVFSMSPFSVNAASFVKVFYESERDCKMINAVNNVQNSDREKQAYSTLL